MAELSDFTLIKNEILEGIKYSLASQDIVFFTNQIITSLVRERNFYGYETKSNIKTITTLFDTLLTRIINSSSSLKDTLNNVIEHLDNELKNNTFLYLNFDIKKLDTLMKDLNIKNSAISRVNMELDSLREDLSLRKEISLEDSNQKRINQTITKLEDLLNDLVTSMNNIITYCLEFTTKNLRILEKLELEKRQEYFSKFETEKNTIIQSFEQKIKDLIFEFNKNYMLVLEDQNKLKKSSTLLIDNVDVSLKNLNDLNERTQKIELEYSTILGNESEKIKTDLNTSKIALLEIVDSIEQEANDKLININNAHTSFINLVQNAGIYELTQNYKTKADEEKSDYKLNMWLTVTAIGLAIIATIAVITIPIVEHWKADPAVDMDYFTLFARFTISIMFFVLALYTSKQAAKHYECYQENHRTFLQLAALEPFMSSMSPDEQKEIRKGLISTYFSQNVDGKFASKGDEVDISANLFSLLSQTLTIVADKKEVKPQDDKA